MIKVAIGTEQYQFVRALEWLDKAIDDGIIPQDEEILVQAGSTKYKPRNKTIKMSTIVPYQQQMDEFKEARVCIIHAGIGNVLDMVDLNRVPIVIPRDPLRKEHIDAHQLEFCEVAKDDLHLPVVYTYNEFVAALQNYNPTQTFPTFKQQLVEYLVGVVEGVR